MPKMNIDLDEEVNNALIKRMEHLSTPNRKASKKGIAEKLINDGLKRLGYLED